MKYKVCKDDEWVLAAFQEVSQYTLRLEYKVKEFTEENTKLKAKLAKIEEIIDSKLESIKRKGDY